VCRKLHCWSDPQRFSYSRRQRLNSSADWNRPVEATTWLLTAKSTPRTIRAWTRIRTFLVYFGLLHRSVETPVRVAIPQVCHRRLEVFVGNVRWWCFRVVGEKVVILNASIKLRVRHGHGRASSPLVVHWAICREVRLRRALTTFDPFDSAFYGFDRSANPF
jgi:hypothetical protein